MTQEREAKRQYKEAFEALAKAKAKMEASAKQEEGLRRDLIESFDGYLEAKVGVGWWVRCGVDDALAPGQHTETDSLPLKVLFCVHRYSLQTVLASWAWFI